MVDTIIYILKTTNGEIFECGTLATAERLQIENGGKIYEAVTTYELISDIPF